ncbi:hypothetical protein ACF8R4_12975 [Pseudomonas sp. FYR_2]|uniref:hypothetical protein n=1 Tax=unclassified Pseudomonas TaxID=196821 RepID=UPI003709E34C
MIGVAHPEQRKSEPASPAFVMPSSENSYGFGYVDGTCIQSLRGYRDHLENIVDSIPEGPLYTHADPNVRWKAVADEQVKVIDSLRSQLREQDALLDEVYQLDIGTPLKRKMRVQRAALSASAEPSPMPDPLGCNECAHTDCGKFDGPRQVECRAMADNACARPGASS